MRPDARRRALIIGVIALALLAGGGAWWWRGQREQQRQVVYAVPPGTAARLAAGERVDILPETILITLDHQDTLVIRNDDTQPITVGPFRIEPGQKFSQQYYNPGTFDLLCTLHATQRLRIVVRQSYTGAQETG